MPKHLFDIALRVFFVIGVSVHIVGLIKPFSAEPVWSHIVHIVSYSICLAAVWLKGNLSRWMYLAGALYPFYYHMQCAVQQALQQQINTICIITCVVLLGGLLLLWQHPKS